MAEAAPEAIGATEPTLAEKEAAYEKFVWANLKRNYIGHYLHGMLGMTGFRLINAPTFLPAYLHMLSGSNTIVGLGLALQQLGGVLSPIVGANQVEHRTKVMPAALWMGGLARLQIIGMALAGWFLSGQTLVVAILSFMFMFGLFMGTQGVVFSLLMAKVIPISRRGRLQAWRNATGGVIAAALAWVAGKYFIEGNMLGNGYATTFLFATILTTAGLWALQALMIEPEPPTTRAQNAEMFGGDADRVPSRALTMGVGTILDARELVLLATGPAKAEIVARAVEGPITSMVSASAIQLHANCKVVVDEAVDEV